MTAAEMGVDALLRAARHHADLSQRELAALAGVDRSVIGKIEAGAVAAPTLPTVVRLLAAAGCRLVAVDGDGQLLAPRPFDEALDAGFRRWPAHLEVREVVTESDWWYGPYLTDMRPLPAFTANWRRLAGRPRGKRLTKKARRALERRKALDSPPADP